MIPSLGRIALHEVRRLVSYSALTVLVAKALVLRPREGGGTVRAQVARQIVFSGWDGIFLVLFIGAAMAISIVALAATLLPTFEATTVMGRVLAHVLVREVAPLMTAILVILRSCGAITVELGNMSWRGEIEGLQTLGIDPIKFVVLPRFAGLAVAVVGLMMLYILAATTAGLLTAQFLDIAPPISHIATNIESFLYPEDLVIAFVKSLLYGGTIASVACYHGLSVRDDITAVPRRASRALVEAITWCTVIGVAITLITL